MSLGIIQDIATPIIADNHGAINMAQSHQPLRRTRHVEMKHFAILQWTDDEFLKYIQSRSDDENYYSDTFEQTNLAHCTKFYEHNTDIIIMGRRKPTYMVKSLKLAGTHPHNILVSTCSNLTLPSDDILSTHYSDESWYDFVATSVGVCENDLVVANE